MIMPAGFSIYFISVAAFIMLLILQITSVIRKSRNLEEVLNSTGNMDSLINKNLIGISVLVPAVVFSMILNDSFHPGTLPSGNIDWFAVWFISIVAVVFFAFLLEEKSVITNQFYSKFFPEPIRFYLFSRCLFLIAYEFFFRGVMFENIKEVAGIEWSIILNIVAYSAVQIYSSKKEIIGTIPFGLLLCLLTIKLQSVWPAVTVHLALTLSYEMRLIKYQKSWSK